MTLKILVGVLCFIVLAICMVVPIGDYFEAKETKTWSRQNAIVADMSIYELHQGRNVHDCLLMHIHHTFLGIPTTSTLTIPNACENAQDIMNSYHIGQKLTVFVNPKDPTQARSTNNFVGDFASNGIFGAFITLILMWSLWQKIKKDNDAIK